jgi:hypothetical protein
LPVEAEKRAAGAAVRVSRKTLRAAKDMLVCCGLCVFCVCVSGSRGEERRVSGAEVGRMKIDCRRRNATD